MPHALLLHLLSLTIISAGLLGSVTIYLAFRKALTAAPAQLPGLGSIFPRFAIVTQIGLGLMILSGLAVMASKGWSDWGQTWLTVKFVIIIILFLNGNIVGKATGMRMGKALAQGGMPPAENPVVLAAVKTLAVYYAVQVVGLAAIICLAVLKP
jgi:hypothetical protein